jgi:hypothetical protein
VGLGKSGSSIGPKSHKVPLLIVLAQDMRSGSWSGSDPVALRLTWLPTEAKTSGPMLSAGKLFTLGEKRSGLERALEKFSRPPVEVVCALESVKAS